MLPQVKPQRIEPGPGQESVWDYPRPPRIEASTRLVEVTLGGRTIASSRRSHRVLETASPPVYYLHPDDIEPGVIVPVDHSSWCEWKGEAAYFDAIVDGRTASQAAWAYPDPKPAFEGLRDHVAFYPGRVDGCYLDGELVRPQPGRFYGGWITREIVGPFKGEAGTTGW